MKKTVLLCFLITICLLSLTGCGNEKNKKEKGPIINAVDATIYMGVDFDATKYASVEDGINLEVIRNDVNDKNPGEYTVTYKATDQEGNSSTKTIIITVDELNQDKLEELINNILKKQNLSSYNLNKNVGFGINIESNRYLNKELNDYRKLKMYNIIPIVNSFNTKDYNLSDGNYIYQIDYFRFYFEFIDSTSPIDERWFLYSMDQVLEITDGNLTLTIDGAEIPELGDFNRISYKSIFGYDMEATNVDTLKEILNSDNVKIKANVTDGYNSPLSTLPPEKITPHVFEYDLSQDDINVLKDTLELYYSIRDLIV